MAKHDATTGGEPDVWLAAHPDIESIELLLPDINGIIRGKRITRPELPGAYRSGVYLAGTTHLVDSRGMLIEGLEHGSHDGDPDFVCQPVPGSLVPVPWVRPGLGQCLIQMSCRDGRPYFADSRQVLALVAQRLAARGLQPVVAVEYEFYLLSDISGEAPRARIARIPGTDRLQPGPQLHSIEDLHELDGFFADVDECCRAQGLPGGSAISEYAPGQYEINLHHVPDPVLACDHALLMRRLVRGVARRHGLVATFMAKPFAGQDGSGMHVHMSLQAADGRNVFAGHPPPGRPDGYAPALRHAIGGLLGTLDESLAIFAPNANSYRRFQAGCFAPVAPNWGPNHRQVAIRIPLSDEANVRLEHRVAGADCNPYLALAAMLAGVDHGLASKVEPPPMVGEGERVPGAVRLTPRWEAALDRFEQGTVLRGYLGPEFCRVFAACRRFEAAQFHAQVSNLDYDWYLRSI